MYASHELYHNQTLASCILCEDCTKLTSFYSTEEQKRKDKEELHSRNTYFSFNAIAVAADSQIIVEYQNLEIKEHMQSTLDIRFSLNLTSYTGGLK